MPLRSSLKRLAKRLIPRRSNSKRLTTPRPRWNDLPEDIFLLILVDHLDTDISSAKTLSQTCKAFAAYCRPFIFRTVCITDSKTLERFTSSIQRTPTTVGAVQTLRITDMGGQMKLQGQMEDSPLTPLGEKLLFILSQDFPRLKSFELPRLSEQQEWPNLSKTLQDAICSFCQRHVSLEEMSVTTHYPLDLIRHCSTIQKLECRVYAPSTRPFNTPLLREQQSRNATFPPLQELIIQDPSDLASTITPHIASPHAGLNLATLEKLTYYGDKSPGSQLLPMLMLCCGSISKLEIFVGSSESNSTTQPLDLTFLTNLTHLTLSHDRVRYGAESIAWIYATLGVVLGLGTSPLTDIEMVIRAGELSFLEMVELSSEWSLTWALFRPSTPGAPS
ncbi:hypothetical protein NMY22_g14436 [Coprinellus aureogranulatus]|nr:hypothetical protein NMY22_g14436 [Coprinellus aureogranulatus]